MSIMHNFDRYGGKMSNIEKNKKVIESMIKTLIETKTDIGEKSKRVGYGCSNEYSLDQEINCLSFFRNIGSDSIKNSVAYDYAKENEEREAISKYKSMDDSIDSINMMFKILKKRIHSLRARSEQVVVSERLNDFYSSFGNLIAEFSKIRCELKANLYNSMVK